ncbi:TrbI/VirB10 family protein [Acidomonas methanolica]|uniref:Conjugal transfer protein TrbI n=2 Tax=Acidomonas methanolica TaxID=437 RepID=A0A023D6T7_ACIMT|nr:TrbI/VirB10 family protein [Acidomonas methanolica]MBU2655525.1 TrbI/VirB10 family protein [Acidomonas methanolica]TCS21709.1 type IV secretion system protein VirB10 [Acidomonas methanolica]GAJ29794.1 conjugal transfer protein TrbI [Acidomonas methanolica NBRC 104435]GEL00351.1 conjugal transfer protein TraI [Acidomonas methanolica NBRC 104435]
MTDNETNAASMRLHAEPPRVTRLSRKVLASVTAVALVGVGGALIYALQVRSGGGSNEELYSTSNRQPADGLAGLPKDYTGPALGPPLPGDLGRPILDAQNRGQPVVPPTIATPTVDEAEQRRRAEEEAARVSRVFFQTQQGSVASASAQAGAPNLTGLDMTGLNGQLTAQDRQLAFMNAPVDRRTTSADRVTRAASPFVVQAGSVIPGALMTGIKSDIPGDVIAQVTQNVYDSPTGRYLLIPQGSKLFGKYNSQLSFAQKRVQMIWTRLIFPNGSSIVLENLPGADTAGYSGLQDQVDNHWGELFKAAALSTVLSVGAEAGTSGSDDSLIRAIRDGASQSISQTGQMVVQRSLNIQPTLTERNGLPLTIIVDRDLVLQPWGADHDHAETRPNR